MLDYLDAISTTNQRQDDTRFTAWCAKSQNGYLFNDREAACAFCNLYPGFHIVYPLYGAE
jgi:hypothetical protein